MPHSTPMERGPTDPSRRRTPRSTHNHFIDGFARLLSALSSLRPTRAHSHTSSRSLQPMVRASTLPPISGSLPMSASSPTLGSPTMGRSLPKGFPKPAPVSFPLGTGVPKTQQFTLYHDYVQRSGVNKLLADLTQDLLIMQPEEPVAFMIDFLKGRLPPPPPDPLRVMMLEDLFQACDDDGSGALSLNEFSQLFDKVDETTRAMFNEVDMDVADGKLTQEEFVTFHLEKFSTLSDETFQLIVSQLTERAEDVDVLDDEAAVVNEGVFVGDDGRPPTREAFLLDKVSKGHVMSQDERMELERAHAGEKVAVGQLLSENELEALRLGGFDREFMLEELFQACDDDGSGALSLNEFSQLFDKVDETTRAMFAEVDMTDVSDGKLTQQEFVDFHLQMFSSLNDDLFQEVVSALTTKAEETDVLDDEAAVVGRPSTTPGSPSRGPSPDPRPSTTVSPTR